MTLNSDNPWRDLWLNEPFQLPIFDGNGQQVLTPELEFIQLKANECVLLVRTVRMETQSYSVDGEKFRTVAKVAYEDFNCFGILLKLRADLEADGHVIGCNGARRRFWIRKGERPAHYGLAGYVDDPKNVYSDLKSAPVLRTFGTFSDVSELTPLAKRATQFLKPKTA